MNAERLPWYEIANVGELDTPSLAVYPDRVRDNILTLKSMVSDPSLLRPHAKTHKSGDAARMLIAEGIRKFKCATIAEAEMLALAGAEDVLIAYQPVGPKVRRLFELAQKYPATKFSTLIDAADAADALSAGFAHHGSVLPVYIDLNVGMNRTGISPEHAMPLYQACAGMKGIRIVGLHAYDGHLQQAGLEERRSEFEKMFAPVERLRAQVQDAAGRPLELVAGGSPTFQFFAARGDVECSPGTFIYWDRAYETLLPEQPFKHAMVILTRVISRPAPGLLCLDAGYKAVACEKDLQHRLHFINASDVKVVSQSEEHVVISAANAGSFSLGDVLYAVPYHICPTCAMYERASVVRAHHAEGEWTMIARDRKITL
jgi:D-threonine aldolase